MRHSLDRPPRASGRRGPRATNAPRRIEVCIERADVEGRGCFTLEGEALSVAGAIPGERVLVDVGGDPPQPRLVRIVEASPHRRTPRCRHAAECGGCTWQHVAYPEQLRLKRAIVQRAVDAALGTGRARVAPVRGLAVDGADRDAGPWGFRHKVHFAFAQSRDGAVVMGHMHPGTRQVFDAAECPVHATRGNEVAFAVKAALRRAAVPAGEPPRGIARHVVSRVGRSSGEVVTTLVVRDNVPSLRRVSREVLGAARPDGWHLNVHERPGAMLFGPHTRHLAGRERVREDVAGVSFLVSPTAFFQTNVEAAAMLADQVLAAVPREATRVLDLYAGLGFFALPLARRGHRVTAVEESPAAVADGEATARLNRIPPAACRFVRAGVDAALERLARQEEAFDVVVLDPPRAGASERAIRLLRAAFRPPRIVYVSCEPEALSRDLARFTQACTGQARYDLASVTPLDMFPHTAHVETVAVLRRDDARR